MVYSLTQYFSRSQSFSSNMHDWCTRSQDQIPSQTVCVFVTKTTVICSLQHALHTLTYTRLRDRSFPGYRSKNM